jgi:glycosyltransferase involved in cell wall biosynthesis
LCQAPSLIALREDSHVINLDRPLQVIVYTDSAGIGGAEMSLGHLVANARDDIHLTVVGVSHLVVNTIADRRPQSNRIVLPESGIRSLIQHYRTFQQLRPDIIHLNLCTPWAGAIGLTAALLVPQARVVRVDQLPLRTTDAWTLWRTRMLCLRVDAHVAVGNASARRMEDFYALGRDSVISIPNGVPDEPTPPSPRGAPVMTVGSIGRLDAMKGHDILLRAIAQLENARAIILGEGDYRSTLETLVQQLGISDRVELPGWVDNPRAHLARFDVIAMPSRSEGFPLAMVEAMLASRAVVATRVGSVPEAIVDQQTGILVEKNDVTGFVNALRDLRDNPQQRQQLGQQARAFAVSQFTAAAMTKRYEQLWYHLRSSPPAARLRVARPKD